MGCGVGARDGVGGGEGSIIENRIINNLEIIGAYKRLESGLLNT